MMRGAVIAFWAMSLLVACKEQEVAAPEEPRSVVSEQVNPLAGFGETFLGEVSSRDESVLGFPIAGTMAVRSVEAGTLVEAGQTLALMDPTELDAEVRSAEAAITVAKSELNNATDAASRKKILFGKGVDTQVDVEIADQNLAAAQASLEQAMASSVAAQDNRGYATLVAPMSGVVSEVFEDSGATLTAGQPVLRLSGIEAREVLIDLAELQLAEISIGASFDLILESNTHVTASAKLASVDPVADSTTRTRRAHLAIESPPQAFRLGALVRVSVEGAEFSRITVPETALRPDGTVLVVARPEGKVRAVAVKTGEVFGGRVLISEGLVSGDEVIVKGVNSIQDGEIVGPKANP